MNERKNRCSRGYTLLETIIALTVIGVVFAAAISMVVSSSRVQVESVRNMEVTNQVENITECFRFAENEGAFIAMLGELGFDGLGQLSKDSYSIVVDADTDATPATVNISVYDAEGNLILEQTYDKG